MKPLTMTVATDIHYYSEENGSSGSAYETADYKSQKLLSGAAEVLRAMCDQIVADPRSDILLISGDTTNNGEMNAHREVIELLRSVKARGKQVYVITATHDYKGDGLATAYRGDEKIKTPAAKREELFDLYREFGPDQAIAVHRESMSYIVQLADGYRLFALNDDTNRNGKSGFSDDCFAWIAAQAVQARADGQFIIAMTHHPLIAPSPVYELIGKGDMLGDYDQRIQQLADLGVQFIFTGHTHIHNISAYQSPQGNVLYDICAASPIGYPGVYRTVTFRPEDGVVHVETEFVQEPESYKKKNQTLRDRLSYQMIGVIREMIDVAGKDIDRFADMATAISIKPKVIYRFGWLLKPVFKFLNALKVGTVGAWTKKETGLKKADWAEIKDRKVVDLITELVLNLYAGEGNYPPESATYKITMGFMSILDSLLRVLHIDLNKILKVVPDASSLVEPLLYNAKIDAYTADLEIYEYSREGEQAKALPAPEPQHAVRKSKKGLPILICAVLLLLVFLPVWLILLLVGFVINQIRYGKKMK
ncbi:MAG: metallophosphoesterase [Clostridia bacterium]|nr:metallophosphoesterase [Clostridia bacterium]